MTRNSLMALALAGSLALPAAAAGAPSAYQRVLQAYDRSGSVPPCQFSSPVLESALTGVDTYGEQYFADFTQAIQDALTTRASGACSSSAPSGGRVAVGASGPGAGLPAHLGSVTAPTDSGVPAPLVALGVLGVVAALGVIFGLWRARAGPAPQPSPTRTPTERL
jgi:hypothetical protein